MFVSGVGGAGVNVPSGNIGVLRLWNWDSPCASRVWRDHQLPGRLLGFLFLLPAPFIPFLHPRVQNGKRQLVIKFKIITFL